MKIYLINKITNKLQSTINVMNLDDSIAVDGSGFIVVLTPPPSEEHVYYYKDTGWQTELK